MSTVRVRGIALGAVLATLVSIPLVAQEPGSTKEADTKAARKGYDAARRVPRFYGQIGLTTEQREKIYAIQAKHMEKIEVLNKQLDELRAKMSAECDAVLTDAQRKLLEQRRAAGTGRSKGGDEARKGAVEKP
jgi:Spy/CpxP family protein refolding chaperone